MIRNTGVRGLAAPTGHGAAPRLFVLLLSLVLLATVAACGKRPSTVDSPAGRPNDRFPHTYPDPATDPKPGTDPGPVIP